MAKRNNKAANKARKRVLVACEYSGRVRDAFIAKGHDAVSCDILPTDVPGPHYQGDLMDILDDDWDMLIGFPPCTHLAVSGSRWFAAKRADGRQQQGIDFFMALANSNIPQMCLENPVGIMSTQWRKPDQIIQPWMFGHPETKATCLWLKGLPLLTETYNVKEAMMALPKKERNRIHYMSPGKDRAKKRSMTYQGVADAMAEQWG